MLKIKNIKNLSDIKEIEDYVIITPSFYELFYKEKYLGKNVDIFTIKNFLINNYSGSLRLASDLEQTLTMYDALKEVSNFLVYYKDILNTDFVKELMNTYDSFNTYKLLDNKKNKDLSIIYKKYESLLLEKGLINIKMLSDKVLENSDLSGKYLFLNIYDLDDVTTSLIKKMSLDGEVTFFIEDINNKSVINKLKEIDKDLVLPDSNISFLNDEYFVKVLNDVSDEVSFIDNDISKKIMEGNFYDDFLIVSNNIDSYTPYFDSMLNHPCSKNETEGIFTGRFISMFCNILKGDFSCESFINILKLGVFDISAKMIDDLDNYVYSWNLSSESFYVPFKYNPNGNKNYMSESDLEKLKRLNDAKDSIINPIKYLLENVIGIDDKKEILKYLYTYLSEENIIDNLYSVDEVGCLKLINSFDTLNDNINGKTSLKEVIELFGLVSFESGKNTLMQDVITISNLSDAVYENKKFIYVIGMTNDNVPANFKLSGLINSDDVSKDDLIEKTDEHYNKEYYSFLKSIKNKNVIITYHKLGVDLKLKTPSVYLDKLSKKEVVHDKLYNKDLLLNNYALMLSFDKIEKIKDELFDKINDSNNHNLNYKISKETALKLYGTKLNLSPSKVEVYAKCPFYFFCLYGLKLNIKERYTFDNRETGSLVHYVLEKIISSNLDEIDLDNLENYVNKYAFLYLEENGKIINNTIKFVVKEVSKSTVLIIKNIIKEQEISKFRPKYFEFRVGEESVVKPVTVNMGDALISVSGIVDRLDVYEDDETYYYRIIDYKTGEKKFRLDDILDGLNLQMLLYLLAIKESSKNITNKKVVPSALLYYPALVKESLSSRSLTKEEEELNVKDKLKMNGMICNDKIVIETLGGDAIGDFISVTTRGKINEEKVFGLDDLNLIFKSIKGTLKHISEEILNGNIKVNPIGGRNDACSFCKFNSICKFDTMLDKKRKSADLKNSEVIKKIEGDYHA